MALNWRFILIVAGIVTAFAFAIGWYAGRDSNVPQRSKNKPSFPFRSQEDEEGSEDEEFDAEAMIESLGDAYGEITLVDEPLSLPGGVDVHPEPDDKTKPVAHLEGGSGVYHVGKLEDWSLIGWPGGKPTSFGWTRLATAKAVETAEPEDEEEIGTIRGTVSFVGTAPTMRVPAARKKADFCKNSDTVHNAVIESGGRLADVYVRVSRIKGAWQPAENHLQVGFRGCVLSPRVQGLQVGQTLEIVNDDPTTHNIRATAASTTLFNERLASGTPFVEKSFFTEAVVVMTCETHKWERSFVFVTDHPFFAVTGNDGNFALNDVPSGNYTIEAWHSQFGVKREHNVRVSRGEETELRFTFSSSDRPPKDNANELRGLF